MRQTKLLNHLHIMQTACCKGQKKRAPETTADLKTIIRIQEKIIRAHSKELKIYKKDNKELNKLFKKAFKNWIESFAVIAGLKKDKKEVWSERNAAVRDYNAVYALAQRGRLTELMRYRLPENHVLDVEGKLLESGKTKIVVNTIPKKGLDGWHSIKSRKQSRKLQDFQLKQRKYKNNGKENK